MKIIKSNSELQIYNDDLKVYNEIPTGKYTVEFSKFKGFYLSMFEGMEVNEKIYGVHDEKVKKVMRSFDLFERNLGVILSGEKGIGKSLFGKCLAREAIRNNIPVIIINRWIPGISDFLDSIKQEVMVFFDEFDKTFGDVNAGDGNANPQTELLGLFDGVSSGKKLYVITCNSLHKLSDYLINRPGRFHYHFRFEYPTAQEIEQYLKDKLNPNYYNEISKVIAFSRKVDLNYDCLRSIAFEINTGISFKEAIKDLNILNLNNSNRYNIFVTFTNGETAKLKNYALDLFGSGDDDTEREGAWFNYSGRNNSNVLHISFNKSDIKFDERDMYYQIHDFTNVKIEVDEDEFNMKDEKEKAEYEDLKKLTIKSMVFKRVYSTDKLHYMSV